MENSRVTYVRISDLPILRQGALSFFVLPHLIHDRLILSHLVITSSPQRQN